MKLAQGPVKDGALAAIRDAAPPTLQVGMHALRALPGVDAVLLLGVDDSEKIWVNGSRVFEQLTARGLTVDQDRVPVHLEAGTNKTVLKLYQNTQGWEFCVRIVTADGQPVPFKQRSE